MKRLGIVVFVCLVVCVSAFHSMGSYRQIDPAGERDLSSDVSVMPAESAFITDGTATGGPAGKRVGVQYRLAESSVDHSWFFFLGFVVIVVLLRDGPGNNGDVPPSGF